MAYLLYLVAANLLLNTRAGYALANLRPEKFHAGWERAITWIPGRVTAWDLKLAGNVRRTVWSVQADVVHGRIELLPLLARQIHITGLRGENVSGGVTRIDSGRPPSEPRPGGWKLVLDDIVVESLRHAYFNQLVLTGTGSGNTSILKTLRGGPTEILPSRAEVHDAVLWWDGQALLRDTELDVRFAMEPNTRAEAPGMRKLLKMDLEVAVSAAARGLEVLAVEGARPRIVATDDPGQLDARILWHKGEIGEGSQLEFTLPVRSSVAGAQAPGMAKLLLQAPEDKIELIADFSAGGSSDFHLRSDLAMEGRSIPIPVTSVAQILAKVSGSILGRWHFQDLSWVARLLPPTVPLRLQGKGSIDADIGLADGVLASGSRISVPDLAIDATIRDQDLEGSMRADLLLEPGTARGEIRPDLSATVDHFRLKGRGKGKPPYLEGRDLAVALRLDQAATDPEPLRAHIKFPRLLLRTATRQLEGSGEGELRFRAPESGRRFEALPSHIEINEGVLALDGRRLLNKARISARLSRAEEAGATAPSGPSLGAIDADAELNAALSGIRVEFTKGQGTRFVPVGDEGRLDGRLALRRGILSPGSRIELSTAVYSPDPRDGAPGQLDLALEVLEDAIGVKAVAGSGSKSDFHVEGDFTMHGREWLAPGQGFEALAARISGKLDGHWRFDDLEWLTRRLQASELITFTGKGRIDAALRIQEGRILESSSVTVPRVSAALRAMQNEFRGDAKAEIGFEPVTRPGELRPHLKALMERFQVAPEQSPDKPYVRGRDLAVEVTVDEGDKPLNELYHAHVRFSNAEVPDLSVYNRYLPTSDLRLLGGSGRLSGDLRLDGTGQTASAELSVRGQQAQLEFAGIGLTGNVSANTRLKARNSGETQHRFEMTGSQFELSDVAVTRPGEEPLTGWWAALHLDDAVIQMGQATDISASLRAQMKDLSVLLALYSEKKHFPEWIGRVLDEGEARMTGRVGWSGRTLILDDFDGRNDRFQAMARLRLQEGQRDGALYVSWHKLGLGLGLQDGRKDFRFVKPREWYDSQPALLPH